MSENTDQVFVNGSTTPKLELKCHKESVDDSAVLSSAKIYDDVTESDVDDLNNHDPNSDITSNSVIQDIHRKAIKDERTLNAIESNAGSFSSVLNMKNSPRHFISKKRSELDKSDDDQGDTGGGLEDSAVHLRFSGIPEKNGSVDLKNGNKSPIVQEDDCQSKFGIVKSSSEKRTLSRIDASENAREEQEVNALPSLINSPIVDKYSIDILLQQGFNAPDKDEFKSVNASSSQSVRSCADVRNNIPEVGMLKNCDDSDRKKSPSPVPSGTSLLRKKSPGLAQRFNSSENSDVCARKTFAISSSSSSTKYIDDVHSSSAAESSEVGSREVVPEGGYSETVPESKFCESISNDGSVEVAPENTESNLVHVSNKSEDITTTSNELSDIVAGLSHIEHRNSGLRFIADTVSKDELSADTAFSSGGNGFDELFLYSDALRHMSIGSVDANMTYTLSPHSTDSDEDVESSLSTEDSRPLPTESMPTVEDGLSGSDGEESLTCVGSHTKPIVGLVESDLLTAKITESNAQLEEFMVDTYQKRHSPISDIDVAEFFSGTSVAEKLERDRRFKTQTEVDLAIRDIRSAMRKSKDIIGLPAHASLPTPTQEDEHEPIWVVRSK